MTKSEMQTETRMSQPPIIIPGGPTVSEAQAKRTVCEVHKEQEASRRRADLWRTQCMSCRFYRRHTEYNLWGGGYVSHRCFNPDAPALSDDGWRDDFGYEPYCNKINAYANCQIYEKQSWWESVWITTWNFLR